MVEHSIVLINEFRTKGLNKFNSQTNRVATSTKKFKSITDAVNNSLSKQSKRFDASSASLAGHLTFFERSFKANDKMVKSVNGLSTSTREATKNRVGFLTQFTKVRWAIVNVALMGAMVGALGKLVFSAEKTRLEFLKLAVVSNESFESVKDSISDLRDETLATNDELISSFQELAKSGFNLAESQDILKASARASLIGFAGLKETAEATAQVLRQFNIDTSEAGTVAFKMAAAANEGRVDIGTLGQALKFSGAIASQTGTSFDELSASIAILSNSGLQMTQIGRGQRQMLLSLLSPSAQAESVLQAYGIQIKDVNGNLKSFTEIIDEFDDSLEGLSEAEKKNIIGKIFPSNAITIVLESLGETNEKVKGLAGNLEELGSESKLQAIILQAENAVTLGAAWERTKLAVLGYADAIVQQFGVATKDATEDVINLKNETIFLAKELGVSEDVLKKIEDIEPTFLDGTKFAERDVKLLRTFQEEFLKMLQDIADAEEEARNSGEENNKVNKEQTEIITDLAQRLESYNLLLDKTTKAVEEYDADVEKINKEFGDTAQAQQLINQLTADYVEIIKIRLGSRAAEIFSDLTKETKNASAATDNFKFANENLQRELKGVADNLSKVRDRIRETTGEINNILGRRFNIRGISETEVSQIIRNQELELQKARFATLGLGSAEEFLRNAALVTTDGLNMQTEAIKKLTDASVTGQDRFEAWRTALQETIRALLISSQDIERDVTAVVRDAQTELLSVTQFDRRGADQFEVMGSNLDALRQAEGIFFGEEKSQLEFSEQLREDRINGMNESADQAIENLQVERINLEALISTEQDWINQQKQFRQELEDNRKEIDDVTRSLDRLRRGLGGGIITPEVLSATGFAGTLALAEAGFTVPQSQIAKAKAKLAKDDFISRPGQAIQDFSPDDTIIGVKNPGQLTGGSNIGTVNINVNGGRFNERTLAIEIQRNIAALS